MARRFMPALTCIVLEIGMSGWFGKLTDLMWDAVPPTLRYMMSVRRREVQVGHQVAESDR